MKKWSELLVYQLFRVAAGIIRALPVATSYRLGAAVGSLGKWLFPKYRKLALHNATIAFGEEKAAEIVKGCFPRMGANFVSAVKLSTMPYQQIHAHLEGWDSLGMKNEVDKGKGLIVLVAHLGNWELLGQVGSMIPGTPVCVVYQRLGNRYIDREIRKMREGTGMRLVERKEGVNPLLSCLRAGGLVAVLADQHAGNSGVWAPFFGRLASTSPLPAMLSMRTGAPILPVAALTKGVGEWRFWVGEPIRLKGHDLAVGTARVNLLVENMVRESPSDWFWVHNRWKTPHPRFLLQNYRRGLGLTEEPVALKPFRILIRSTNWLGDCVMTLPAVKAIKDGRPDAYVTVVCRAKLADFWKRVTCVDEVLSVPDRAGVAQVAALIRNKPAFDAGVLFPNSTRSALELWFAKVPRRVGVPGRFRSYFLNQIVRYEKPAKPRHQMWDYLALAGAMGAAVPEEPSVAGLVRVKRSEADRPYRIGVCAGAEFGPAKRWLPERFAAAIREISARRQCEWILFGVSKDAEIAASIAKEAGGHVVDRVGQTKLSELIDELGSCDLLLTNDSGPMHLAAAIGVPTISLFGSTEPVLTGPIGTEHRVLRRQVECSPCFLRQCPIDFRCMKAIEVSEVVETVLRAMEMGRSQTN